MSAKPPADTKPATLHELVNRLDNSVKVFEWTGTAWSTPGTRWSTKPTAMSTLGWRYLGPKE